MMLFWVGRRAAEMGDLISPRVIPSIAIITVNLTSRWGTRSVARSRKVVRCPFASTALRQFSFI
ncbi:hypothetical protein CCHR01_07973 [Colletotrichum chrysophilum]|uniref:Uncharacterized protein n=1 Tax=Colletotrichum chrysophilum TaxID=1836956 RepID=A0AAD9ELX4_9PEZI|nr:hypothetical protein CCHR01_07973 [Colletotrichum chrysophilum]